MKIIRLKYAFGLIVLTIIGCTLSFYFFISGQNIDCEKNYMKDPYKNDLYIVDYKKIFRDCDPLKKYGVMRIKEIKKGTIEFQLSSNTYKEVSLVEKDICQKKTSKQSYYDGKSFYIKKGIVGELKTDGAIISIQRIP